MSQPVQVYEVDIAAPAAEVWDTIVDGEATVRDISGTQVESTWEPGLETLLEAGRSLAVTGPDSSE